MLLYSRKNAEISDDDANKKLYGKELNAKQIIVEGEVKTHAAGQPLEELLNKTSPRHA
jgi:lipid-binding SYLF domain-containing protein